MSIGLGSLKLRVFQSIINTRRLFTGRDDWVNLEFSQYATSVLGADADVVDVNYHLTNSCMVGSSRKAAHRERVAVIYTPRFLLIVSQQHVSHFVAVVLKYISI